MLKLLEDSEDVTTYSNIILQLSLRVHLGVEFQTFF